MNACSLSVMMYTKVVKSIALSIIFCIIFPTLQGLSNQLIVEYAQKTFPRTIPGIEKLIQDSTNNKGASFELESALVRHCHDGDQVLGFNLEITFEKETAQIAIDGHEALLNSTEFDIITSHCAIECKSGTNIDGRCFSQLRKEQAMLAWMKSLKKDLEAGDLTLEIKRHSHARTFFKLQGASTRDKPIILAISWINGPFETEYIAQLVEVIQLLATKKMMAFYKTTISDAFQAKLMMHGIGFEQHVNFC